MVLPARHCGTVPLGGTTLNEQPNVVNKQTRKSKTGKVSELVVFDVAVAAQALCLPKPNG